MAVGFGRTTETASQYMSNYLRQYKKRDPFALQDYWHKHYLLRKCSYSVSSLLEPKYDDLEILVGPDCRQSSPGYENLIWRVLAFNGLWNVQVEWDLNDKSWGFTIAVKAGDRHRFHPEVIEEDITRKYGPVIYKQWQAMVMDDLDSLKTLVNEVRDRIDFVAPSVVCCERSARLCRRVGIPVKGQFAFLFPSSYSL